MRERLRFLLAAACVQAVMPDGAVEAGLWPLPAFVSSGSSVVALGPAQPVYVGQPCAVSARLQERLHEALTSERGCVATCVRACMHACVRACVRVRSMFTQLLSHARLRTT
jgi:hypothetical protein